MVGRNDLCPCGSGKKYKKCCERVVAIQSAEQLREERELNTKTQVVSELNRWFEGQLSRESEYEWSRKFKEDLNLEVNQPIPPNFTYSFRFWLLFDAPCLNGQRVVDAWKSTLENKPDALRIAEELCDIHLCCYEILHVNQGEVTLQSLTDHEQYRVRVAEPTRRGTLMFARLSRLGNRYELFGPYTSFGDEMRGEIFVYLKNQAQKEGELKQEFWHRNGLQVIGWLMQRAQEMEQLEKMMASTGTAEEAAPTAEKIETTEPKDWLPRVLPLPEEDRGIPEMVELQLEQFDSKFVSGFQKKTQELYRHSLDLFRTYIATHFGKSFTWSLLTEESLSHFFSVWYVDQEQSSPVRSKIFLNTLKGLFRWLQEEAICDVYTSFAEVYRQLIRTLPLAFDAKLWLKENGVMQGNIHEPTLGGTYMLSVSPAGATLDVGEKWVPVHMNLRGLPPSWMENRFWVRGTVAVHDNESCFTEIETVYPFLPMAQVETV
ncbi:SEC-C domain-containing protein [Salinithrix halophila]|uniref:SEC-C domain-containing protein n=1 Tax=Salinithrix halophila TaxID=1485204 RepID=A0ABV8JCI2_9BACL